jgi:hypothetical protein
VRLWILEFDRKPRAGVGPPSISSAGGDGQDIGTLCEHQPAEKSQLDEFGEARLVHGQALQGFVEAENIVVVRIDGNFVRLQVAPTPLRRAFQGMAGPGAVNKDPTHRLGGRLKIIALGSKRAITAELEKCFVDQESCYELQQSFDNLAHSAQIVNAVAIGDSK